jgi:nucleotide-binding universal stress UspA family protein
VIGILKLLEVLKGGGMYRKIVVPLDGSELAECVLPHVEGIAKSVGAEVDLVRVIPHLSAAYAVEIAEDVIGKERAEVDRYLDKVAKGLEAKGIKVEKCVHEGHPAEEIAIHAERSGCDLIVIATHGRSGPSRWAYGSVTDKVLRTSCVPIMMVRPPTCIPKV